MHINYIRRQLWRTLCCEHDPPVPQRKRPKNQKEKQSKSIYGHHVKTRSIRDLIACPISSNVHRDDG